MGSLFKKPKVQQALAPAQQTTPVLPDEEELKRSKRRKAAKRFGRGGRDSTILSQGLGG